MFLSFSLSVAAIAIAVFYKYNKTAVDWTKFTS